MILIIGDTLFELTNVGYSYPGQIEALRDISLKIQAGDQIAILGANGSGKSTLLKILGGLIFPSSGTVNVYKQPLTEKMVNGADHGMFMKEFRKKVGLVFQNSDAQLFCPTVFDEIAFGPLQLEIPREEIIQRVEDVIEMLEIQHLKNRSPHSLSGGEKKRVAIASVLPMNPEILLLDEPSTGLDPRTQSWFEDFLHSLGKAGKTIIMATHDLDIADAVSKRAVILNEDHMMVANDHFEHIIQNHTLLLDVNLIHEHYHQHGSTWHSHEQVKHHHTHKNPQNGH